MHSNGIFQPQTPGYCRFQFPPGQQLEKGLQVFGELDGVSLPRDASPAEEDFAVFEEGIVDDEIVRDARDVNKVRQERLRVLKDEADAAVVIGANADAEDSLLNLFEDLKTIEDDMPRAFIDANGTSPRLADALGFHTLKADQSTWFTVILDWLREHYELEFQI